MPQVRMDIESVVVGNGPVSSMLVLRPRDAKGDTAGKQLPIRIGVVEATQISAGVAAEKGARSMTHDLLRATIDRLGATVSGVSIDRVEGTTFYATIDLLTADGEHLALDARPSDAVALAVRTHSPVYASTDVIARASYPSFSSIKRDEREREAERFHEFVESLTPDDFLADGHPEAGQQ